MAEIRRVSRAAPLSAFQQVAPAAGGALSLLADTARQAYEFMAPAAAEAMAQRGDEEVAAQVAQRSMGAPPPPPPAAPVETLSTSGRLDPLGFPTGNGTVANGPPAPGEEPARGAPVPAVTTSPLPASLIGTESGGNLRALNSEGYGGRGQFGADRLRDAYNAGVIDRPMTGAEFSRASEETQAAVEAWHRRDIESFIDRNDLSRFLGTQVNGAPVTQNGMLAVAHLGGTGGLKRFLESGGSYDPADSNGTNLSDYLRTHQGTSPASNTPQALAADTRAALGLTPRAASAEVLSTSSISTPAAAPMSSVPPPAAPAAAAPTMVRTADGALAPRLYSPMAGPILQAYNAAATMTWMTDALLNGRTDLLSMSNEMPLDAEGFQQAAQGYVNEAVAAAPARLRRDLRAKLMDEANSRYLGMVDEQQADIRQRAANSNGALIDRHSEDYATRLASGDAAGAESARLQLEEALYARESLPGLAFTREQSINSVLQAQRNGERLMETRRREQEATYKDGLNTIIAARENGLTAENEAMLDDPAVWAAHPELAAEAAAKIEFQEAVPSFGALTPAQQAAEIAAMRAAPVGAEWNIDIVKAAEDIATANASAWEEDPIARAAAVLPNPPPPIPAPDPANPQGFIDALAARRDYGRSLAAQGYIEQPAFLSDQEVETVSAMFGAGVPAEARLMVASALATGFGDDAARVFDALEMDDSTAFAGKLMSRGGSVAVATEIVQGQQMLDEGLASLPERAGRIEAFAPDVAAAFAGIPGDSIAIQGEVMAAAGAIYAARNPGLDPSDSTASAKMTEAVNAALGQSTDGLGRTVGGVQTVNGHPVLLPVSVAGEQVQEAFGRMAGVSRWSSPQALGASLRAAPQDLTESWQIAAPDRLPNQGVPYAGGQPITRELLRSARLIPLGGNEYRMEIARQGTTIDVATADGAVFVIDLARFGDLAK